MNPSRPIIEIIRPDGQHRDTHRLNKDCTTIGRYPEVNDIALQPDPQQYVTRQRHCSIEWQGTNWYIVKHGRNAVLIGQEGENLQLVQEKTLLSDGDEIYIRAWRSEAGIPQFWKLVFRDPEGTQPTDSVVYLDYDEISGKVIKRTGGISHRISLPLREDKLFRYMTACNRENGGTPTLIPINELMWAVWEEKAQSYGSEELYKLIALLNREIEPDPRAPKFIINERGRGYLLKTHIVPSVKSDIRK